MEVFARRAIGIFALICRFARRAIAKSAIRLTVSPCAMADFVVIVPLAWRAIGTFSGDMGSRIVCEACCVLAIDHRTACEASFPAA